MNNQTGYCQARRENEWVAMNPILGLGEMGYATDVYGLKIGDGFTPWNNLPYVNQYNKQIQEDTELLPVLEDMVVRSADILGPEPYIEIKPDRSIKVPEVLKNVAVQYDAMVETVTFRCPRFWDEHDLSNNSEITILYHHSTSDSTYNQQYISTVSQIEQDYFTFDWEIGYEVTQKAGSISFSINILSQQDQWSWNSQICQNGFNILPGYQDPDDVEYGDLTKEEQYYFDTMLNDLYEKVEPYIPTMDPSSYANAPFDYIPIANRSQDLSFSDEQAIRYTGYRHIDNNEAHTAIDDRERFKDFIVTRNAAGNVSTGIPQSGNDAVNKEYLEEQLQDIGTGIEVDEHYSATSSNPQSGKAVAEAISQATIEGAEIVIDETVDPTSPNAVSGKAVADALNTKVNKVSISDSTKVGLLENSGAYAYVAQYENKQEQERLIKAVSYSNANDGYKSTLALRDNNGRLLSVPLGFPNNTIGSGADTYPNFVATAKNMKQMYEQVTSEYQSALAALSSKHLWVKPTKYLDSATNTWKNSQYYDFDDNGNVIVNKDLPLGKYCLLPGHTYLAQGSNLQIIDDSGDAVKKNGKTETISGATALLVSVPSTPTYDGNKGYVWYVYCLMIVEGGLFGVNAESAIFTVQEVDGTNKDKTAKAKLTTTAITTTNSGNGEWIGGNFQIWEMG